MARPKGQTNRVLTHFLCIPLVTPASKLQLQTSLEAWKTAIVSKGPNPPDGQDDQQRETENSQLVPLPPGYAKAIRPVGALHLTLGVMSLGPEELSAAIDLLHGLDVQSLLQAAAEQPSAAADSFTSVSTAGSTSEENCSVSTERACHVSSDPLVVDLKGLASMHAPHRTSILYIAPSDHSDRLYSICSSLRSIFQHTGFLVKENRKLKLHATIFNTIYAKKTVRSRRDPNVKAPLRVDATDILRTYKNYVWANDVVLDRIAICEMGTKKVLDDRGNVKSEEYTEVASISLS